MRVHRDFIDGVSVVKTSSGWYSICPVRNYKIQGFFEKYSDGNSYNDVCSHLDLTCLLFDKSRWSRYLLLSHNGKKKKFANQCVISHRTLTQNFVTFQIKDLRLQVLQQRGVFNRRGASRHDPHLHWRYEPHLFFWTMNWFKNEGTSNYWAQWADKPVFGISFRLSMKVLSHPHFGCFFFEHFAQNRITSDSCNFSLRTNFRMIIFCWKAQRSMNTGFKGFFCADYFWVGTSRKPTLEHLQTVNIFEFFKSWVFCSYQPKNSPHKKIL